MIPFSRTLFIQKNDIVTGGVITYTMDPIGGHLTIIGNIKYNFLGEHMHFLDVKKVIDPGVLKSADLANLSTFEVADIEITNDDYATGLIFSTFQTSKEFKREDSDVRVGGSIVFDVTEEYAQIESFTINVGSESGALEISGRYQRVELK